MVNTPIPHSLKSEARKATKILRDFSIPSAKAGPDKVIPAGLIVNAEGLAVITVVRVGFLVSARGGSGIVIAKLPGGGWSPPSAIGIAGLGGGLELGAEVTDFVIILNKRSAVDAFSKGGNLTLGGNFTIAAGPLGRNLEGDVSLRSPAAIYTYSKTKGLFAGISVEGSCLIERKDANKKYYGCDVRAYDILCGQVDTPPVCSELYETLDKHEDMFGRCMRVQAKKAVRKTAEKGAERAAPGLISRVKSMKVRKHKHSTTDSHKTSSKTTTTSTTTTEVRSRRHSAAPSGGLAVRCASSSSDEEVDYSSYHGMRRSQSHVMQKRHSFSNPAPAMRKSSSSGSAQVGVKAVVKAVEPVDPDPWDEAIRAVALWDFDGERQCDLVFSAGDEIEILTRTDTQDDWWEGVVHGKVGIFPANFVMVS